MTISSRIVSGVGAVCALAAVLLSQPAPPREQVGPLPSGAFLLNSGWKLTPAGRQVEVGTFPMATALSRDGHYLLVLNGGVAPPSISVLDVTSGSEHELSRTPVADGWLGLAFNPAGDRVYVGGGSRNSVFEFRFSDGALTPARTFLTPEKVTPKRDWRDFVGDVTVSPDGKFVYAAELYRNRLAVIDLSTGLVTRRAATGRRPYRVLFTPDGQSLLVSNWADGTLSHLSAGDGSTIGATTLGPHPTDIVFRQSTNGYTLFVAAANTNSVFSATLAPNGEITRGDSVSIGFTQTQPLGMTPSALALTPDAKALYVVCSNANAVAQVDLTGDRPVVAGFIPVGWYPTAARVLSDGRLIAVNGRGARSYPNPKGPSPLVEIDTPHKYDAAAYQYVGLIQNGSVSFIAPLQAEQLARYTHAALDDAAYRDEKLAARPQLPSGIKHVILVVKENRTYDQVLGDMREGNGDASLNLFGESVTPNQHKLARDFVLLDNFYVNSDVSADGHNWTTAAIAPDYVEKLWPNSYGDRRDNYDYEGGEPAALPPAGYLWSNASMANISMRNYGYWVTNKEPIPAPGTSQVLNVKDPQLAPATDARYRGFDLDYTDVDRAQEFIRELHGYEQSGSFPQLIFVRLGNDHTSGLEPGKIAPLSAVADNDYALGMIAEALSRSKFWGESAMFVVEDDAQDGADHVDSHRSPAFVISPFVRRHQVDSTMYNTVSILRTMELLIGLNPMTQFDAGARVMSSLFQTNADPSPFTAEQPRTALGTRNPARRNPPSARLKLDHADENSDAEMNRQIWMAVRGTHPPEVSH